MINRLKWASTFFILVGILLTNLNIYPLNIFVHGTGAIGWTMVGYDGRSGNINKFWTSNPFVYNW